MSDWVGIWDFAGVTPNATARFAPACAGLGLEPVWQTQSAVVAAAAFATPGFEDRVSSAQSPFGFAIAAGKPQSPELNAAQHAFDLYLRGGTSYRARLHGAFAVLIYDQPARRLQLVRDPVGTIPIYYTTVGTSVLFATRIAPLLEQRSRAEPNPATIAELFLGGRWFAAGETLYTGITVLSPGHVLTLDASGLQVQRYWDFPTEENRLRDPAAYRFEFARLFEQAVRRQLGARGTAVFVSGGLDSAAVYAAAHDLLAPGSTPRGITWSTADGSLTDESLYIAALEQRFDQPIERIALQPTHDGDDDESDIRYGELPIINNLPGTSGRAYAAARATGSDVVLDGGWGDHVLAPFPPLYVVSMLRDLRWLQATQHLRSYLSFQASSERGNLLRQFGRAFLRLHAPAWLLNQRRRRARMQRAAGPFTDRMVRLRSPVERWAEWLPVGTTPHARSILQTVYHPAHPLRYESTAKMTARHGIESLQPFLDRDLIAFLATIPGDVHSRNGVPKAILRDSLTGMLPDVIRSRRDKGDYTDALRAGIEPGWSRYKARITDSECAFDWQILEPRRVRERLALLEQQRQIDPVAASWELIELYGLVVWLEVFFGAGKTSSSRRPHERIHGATEPGFSPQAV